MRSIPLSGVNKKELDIFLSSHMHDPRLRPLITAFRHAVLTRRAEENQNAQTLKNHFEKLLKSGDTYQHSVEKAKRDLSSLELNFSVIDIEDFSLLLLSNPTMQSDANFPKTSSAFFYELLNQLPSGSAVELHLKDMNIERFNLASGHNVIISP